jgi:hypothetical protein
MGADVRHHERECSGYYSQLMGPMGGYTVSLVQ